MKVLPYLLGVSLAVTAVACEESEDVGSSLIRDEVAIVVDSTYTISGRSVKVDSIQSRTTTQLLGRIDAKGYGRFSSDFVTQFMAAGAIDTTGVTVNDIDSVKLVMAVPLGGYVGDSIAPMGLTVYELPSGAQVPSPIYSNFRPAQHFSGMKQIASQIYACNALSSTDSVTNTSYRYIFTKLPVELGRRLFTAYKDNPASYLEPSSFTSIFPGLYVTNSYGSGRVVKIDGTSMRIYYHSTTKNDNGNDTTIYKTGTYYAVTPEVVTNNNISFAMSQSLDQMVDDGQTLIVAPTGMDVEFTFPLPEMIERYRDNDGALTVVNALSLTIPAATIANDYGIKPPQSLLMVLSARKKDFFAQNQVVDNVYSFYASYDAVNHCYTFSGMRDYLVEMLGKTEITPDDYTFTLTPVDVVTENYGYSSSSVFISSIAPYIATPVMTRLLLPEARVVLTYSKQSVKL